MRTLGFCLLLLTLAGCSTLEKHPNPLTPDDLIARAKSGATAKAMIDEIFYTDTLIALNAAETVRLHDAGVPDLPLGPDREHRDVPDGAAVTLAETQQLAVERPLEAVLPDC